MRIVHVYKDYYPILGGIENHVRTLAEGQAAAGHQVTVLVTNPQGLASKESLNGVEIVRANRLATVASTPLSVAFFSTLRSLQRDITHLHFPYPVGELAQLAAGKGHPYVITYHSDVVRQKRVLRFYRPFLTRVLQRSQRIIATSENYINSSPFLSPLKDHCTVVPLAVADRYFAPSRPLFRSAATPTLLFVGRHRYYKGVDDLIRALTNVDAWLLVAGDGPMRMSWEQLTREVGVQERVRFLGDVEDDAMPGLYASADIFVLPANARAEAFGKVLLEAMASGLPCITTELGTGTSYVVQHGATGLVVPPKQPEALAQAIQTLLADEMLRKQMGARGHERARRAFTAQRMVTAVEAVYCHVLRQFNQPDR